MFANTMRQFGFPTLGAGHNFRCAELPMGSSLIPSCLGRFLFWYCHFHTSLLIEKVIPERLEPFINRKFRIRFPGDGAGAFPIVPIGPAYRTQALAILPASSSDGKLR